MGRIAENNEVISDILQIIDKADRPVGAGTIRRELSKTLSVSQASIGIILRDLQDRNFVERQGYKGHTITPEGKKFLLEHQARQKQAHLTGRILKRLSMNSAKCLIDILEARRAVETEVARLAAKRATEVEITALKRNLAALAREREDNPRARELDAEFHLLLRKSARNPLLTAMFDLYEQATSTADGQDVIRVIGQARKQCMTFLTEDHARVVRAIAEHDEDAAVKAMGDHVDHVTDFITKEAETFT